MSLLFYLNYLYLYSWGPAKSLDRIWRLLSNSLITDGKRLNTLKTTRTGPLPEGKSTLKYFPMSIPQDAAAKSSQINTLPGNTYSCPPASGYLAGKGRVSRIYKGFLLVDTAS